MDQTEKVRESTVNEKKIRRTSWEELDQEYLQEKSIDQYQ